MTDARQSDIHEAIRREALLTRYKAALERIAEVSDYYPGRIAREALNPEHVNAPGDRIPKCGPVGPRDAIPNPPGDRPTVMGVG